MKSVKLQSPRLAHSGGLNFTCVHRWISNPACCMARSWNPLLQRPRPLSSARSRIRPLLWSTPTAQGPGFTKGERGGGYVFLKWSRYRCQIRSTYGRPSKDLVVWPQHHPKPPMSPACRHHVAMTATCSSAPKGPVIHPLTPSLAIFTRAWRWWPRWQTPQMYLEIELRGQIHKLHLHPTVKSTLNLSPGFSSYPLVN